MWALRKTAHASFRNRSAEQSGCAPMLKESRGRMMSVGNGMLVESMGFPPLPLLELCGLSYRVTNLRDSGQQLDLRW